MHFEVRHGVFRLEGCDQALPQKAQQHQSGKHKESFGRRSIGRARAVRQGVPSNQAAVQDHDRRRPNQDAIEQSHDHLG